jgi:hypothetical protein
MNWLFPWVVVPALRCRLRRGYKDQIARRSPVRLRALVRNGCTLRAAMVATLLAGGCGSSRNDGDAGFFDGGGPTDAGVDAGVDGGILDAGEDAGRVGPYFGTPIVSEALRFITQMAAADFNDDGKMDLVAVQGLARDDAGNAIFLGKAVEVLLGNGDGTFGQPIELLTLASPAGVAALDIDGDGLPDIAVGVCRAGDDRLSYFLNRGGGLGFGPRQDLAVVSCPYALAVVAGLSGDGRPGLATAGPGPDWLDAGSGEVDTFVAVDGGLQL